MMFIAGEELVGEADPSEEGFFFFVGDDEGGGTPGDEHELENETTRRTTA
jgi:hypothetical protein